MAKREWWQRPRLRTDEESELERKVSWLELFFDLYFVVVIAQLANHLATHPSWAGIGQFVFLFLPVWWVWIGTTYYIERFETEGIEHRLMIFAQMIPLAGLGVFAREGLGETSMGYGLSYAVCRIFQTYLWWRGGYYDRQFRPTAKRFVTGFSISIALFLLSALVPPPGRFVLWGLGLVIDIVTPLFTMQQQAQLPRFSTSKLPERYGLFTIIVLGESVVGVVSGLAEKIPLTVLAAMAGILGIALAFGIWWIYFDFIGRRPPKPGTGWVFIWGYSHMPLVISIAATGAGILNVIADEDGSLSYAVGLLIAGSIATSLSVMGILELCLRRDPQEPTHPRLSPGLKFAGAGVASLFGLLSNGMNVIVLELLLLGVLLVQMGYGLSVWFGQEVDTLL